jgi:hypothetical protein
LTALLPLSFFLFPIAMILSSSQQHGGWEDQVRGGGGGTAKKGRVLLVASGCSGASVKRCQREACALGRDLAAVAPGVCVYARHDDVTSRETLPCRIRDVVAPLSKPWFGAMRPLPGVDMAVVVGGTPWTRASDVEVCLTHGLHVRVQPPLGNANICHALHRFAEARRLVIEATGPELVVDDTLNAAKLSVEALQRKEEDEEEDEEAVITLSHDADLGDEDLMAAHAFAAVKVALWCGVWTPENGCMQIAKPKEKDGGGGGGGAFVLSVRRRRCGGGDMCKQTALRPRQQRGLVVSLRRGSTRFTAVARNPTGESNLRVVHRRFVQRVQSHNLLCCRNDGTRRELEEAAAVARDCATGVHAVFDSVFCEALGARVCGGGKGEIAAPPPLKWVGTILEMEEVLKLCGGWTQAVRIATALRSFETNHPENVEALDNCIAAAMIRFAGRVGTLVHESPTYLGGPHDKPRPLLPGVETRETAPLRGARPGWGHSRYLWEVLRKNENCHAMRREWRDALLLLQCTGWLFSSPPNGGREADRGIANVDDWATLARSRWLLSLGDFQPGSSGGSEGAEEEEGDDGGKEEERFASELLTRIFPQPLVW